jgi:cytochrome P450
MSHYLDDPPLYGSHYVWTWTAIALLFASLVYLRLGQRLEKKSCYPQILPPPRSKWGLFETLERLYSVHFHDYCLHEARNEGKIVEVNVWPLVRVPVFSIHDPKVARKILENPNSLKPRGLYDFFDGVMGGTSFISEEGERYKHPRKSVSIGISHSNMDSMLTKMHSVMDEWIAANLGKSEGAVVNVDITMEMQKATIQSIGKIAFGYDFSQGETDRTLSNLVKGFDEFGVACEMNPIRKSPLGIFLWAAKREALHCVQDTRLLLQNVLLSHESKSAKEKMRAVALNELITPGRYETIGGAEALISDMKLLFVAGFDTSKLTFYPQVLENAIGLLLNIVPPWYHT